ncbi:MAG TPA: chemotaxis protein CheW [Polyangia bacterium]
MSPEQPARESQLSVQPTPEPTASDSLLAFVDSILARPAVETVSPQAELQPFVTFSLGQQEFGIPILRCREIVRVGDITRIPEAPPHVRGVLNLRGRVLPIMEIRTCLGLGAVPLTERSRVILAEAQGRTFGLLVDEVPRIAKLATSTMQTPPAETTAAHADKVTAVAQRGTENILVLDVDRLLEMGSDRP